jgi:hypothetical protein
VDALVRRATGPPGGSPGGAAPAMVRGGYPDIPLCPHGKAGTKPQSFWHKALQSDYTKNNYDTAEYVRIPNRRNYQGMTYFVQCCSANCRATRL